VQSTLSPTAPSFQQIGATIPGPRSPRGRRYSLGARVAATAAMLANHMPVLTMAGWTAALCPHAKHALGVMNSQECPLINNQHFAVAGPESSASMSGHLVIPHGGYNRAMALH